MNYKVVVVCSVIILLILGFLILSPFNNQNKATQNELSFTGNIKSFSDDCFAVDGDCSVQVDSKNILIFVGGPPPAPGSNNEEGQVIGLNRTSLMQQQNELVGKKVEVFGKIEANNTITLVGSNKYYFKLLD